MNSRQRVRAALNHVQPDRIPVDFGSTNVTTIHKEVYLKLLSILNIQDNNIRMMDFAQQLVIPCDELLQHFNVDTRCVKLHHSSNSKIKFLSDDEFIDDWGLLWKRPEGGLYYDVINNPMGMVSSVEEVHRLPWPEISDIASAEGVSQEAQRLYDTTEYSLVGSFGSSIFMRAQFLRGYEQLFIDMAIQPEIAEALFDRILEIRIGLVAMLLDSAGEYLDVIELADDLAGQNGPLLSPQLYRDLIKPRTKALIDYIKSRSKAKIMYHCCGSVVEFIEDFIEIGIDIINPVQVSAKDMDTRVLKEKYGDRIVFWGGIDAQRILPNGTVDDVEKETRKRLAELGEGGGYVAFASHNIQADVSPENIIAMFSTLKNYC